jgi:hypothetical protein
MLGNLWGLSCFMSVREFQRHLHVPHILLFSPLIHTTLQELCHVVCFAPLIFYSLHFYFFSLFPLLFLPVSLLFLPVSFFLKFDCRRPAIIHSILYHSTCLRQQDLFCTFRSLGFRGCTHSFSSLHHLKFLPLSLCPSFVGISGRQIRYIEQSHYVPCVDPTFVIQTCLCFI